MAQFTSSTASPHAPLQLDQERPHLDDVVESPADVPLLDGPHDSPVVNASVVDSPDPLLAILVISPSPLLDDEPDDRPHDLPDDDVDPDDGPLDSGVPPVQRQLDAEADPGHHVAVLDPSEDSFDWLGLVIALATLIMSVAIGLLLWKVCSCMLL